MQKRKLLFISNHCGLYTGFGRHIRALLSYLYKNYSNKYEIILAAQGMQYFNPDFERFPWQIHGVLPMTQQEIDQINRDPAVARLASYGEPAIESLVQKFKPDVIFGVEDEWGVNFLKDKKFFKYIPTVFHVTLDSYPIMAAALDTASKTPYYFTWTETFAKTMREKHNLPHVQSLYPCFETEKFYKLPNSKRLQLRQQQNLPLDATICSFVFRNQTRKLVNKLIEGFSIFQKTNPEHAKNTYILTHTHYSEGWDIPKLCKDYNVDTNKVLCTYICRATKEYFILPFKGQDLDNPKNPNLKKTLITVNVKEGVSEEQLNEIYNLTDLYVHPANSGACEMPIIEASLAEKPIATVDYSYGEDVIALNKGAFKIDFGTTTEFGTQFLKADPNPYSIAKIIKKIVEMDVKDREKLGKMSREWALANYDVRVNAEKLVKIVDNIPQHNWDFRLEDEKPKNDKYPMPQIEDNVLWLLDIYKNILNMTNEHAESDGVKYWLNEIRNGKSRQEIYNYFIHVAVQDNNKNKKVEFTDLLTNNGRKRYLMVLKESMGDILMATALFESWRKKHPDWDLYFACEPKFNDILAGNPYIHKVLPYHPQMEQELAMIGFSNHMGFFDGYCNLPLATQRQLNYLAENNIDIEVYA